MKDRKMNIKQILLDIRYQVLRGERLTFDEFKNQYSEEEQFYRGLYHVTTTSNAICKALDIDRPNGTRHKRYLEDIGQLAESLKKFICPLSGHKAKKLTTNPNRFELLKKTNQLKLF